VLLVVLEQRVREVEDRDHPLVGDPVVDGPVLSARVDEAAPAQAGEVVGRLRLRNAKPLDELVTDVRTWTDDVAERIMAVGGSADGRIVTVAEASPLEAFPSGPLPSDKVVALVVERLDQIVAATRPRIDRLDVTDLVSQDLVISIVAGLEKHRWMFSTEHA
jgi:hypothetical protein